MVSAGAEREHPILTRHSVALRRPRPRKTSLSRLLTSMPKRGWCPEHPRSEQQKPVLVTQHYDTHVLKPEAGGPLVQAIPEL